MSSPTQFPLDLLFWAPFFPQVTKSWFRPAARQVPLEAFGPPLLLDLQSSSGGVSKRDQNPRDLNTSTDFLQTSRR